MARAIAANPPPSTSSAPGTLISQERIFGAPEGTEAFRILYLSNTAGGASVAVSGLLIVPNDKPPASGRPVVAWAHPTTGVVARCAPSTALFRFEMIPGLQQMTAQGWAVVATDYPGLGMPGIHPYLVGDSEAHAVLDSVRAAQSFAAIGRGGSVVIWGHSQGGHAALFAGLLAASYAPELHLAGIAVAAPATELTRLFNADLETPAGRNLTAMTLWSWSRIFGAPMGAVVDPSAIPVINRLADECIESMQDVMIRRRTTGPLAKAFLRVKDFAGTQPWAGLLAANTPGLLPPRIPVFVAQGAADQIVPPAITQDYVGRLCAAGSHVQLDIIEGQGHAFIARSAAPAVTAWMAARFAGAPPPSNCAGNRIAP